MALRTLLLNFPVTNLMLSDLLTSRRSREHVRLEIVQRTLHINQHTAKPEMGVANFIIDQAYERLILP